MQQPLAPAVAPHSFEFVTYTIKHIHTNLHKDIQYQHTFSTRHTGQFLSYWQMHIEQCLIKRISSDTSTALSNASTLYFPHVYNTTRSSASPPTSLPLFTFSVNLTNNSIGILNNGLPNSDAYIPAAIHQHTLLEMQLTTIRHAQSIPSRDQLIKICRCHLFTPLHIKSPIK